MKIYYNRYDKGYILSKRSRKIDDQQYEIVCNKNNADRDVYIETWLLENGDMVDIRYGISGTNAMEINELRNKRAKEANSELAYIVNIRIPEERYRHIEQYMTYFPK